MGRCELGEGVAPKDKTGAGQTQGSELDEDKTWTCFGDSWGWTAWEGAEKFQEEEKADQ